MRLYAIEPPAWVKRSDYVAKVGEYRPDMLATIARSFARQINRHYCEGRGLVSVRIHTARGVAGWTASYDVFSDGTITRLPETPSYPNLRGA